LKCNLLRLGAIVAVAGVCGALGSTPANALPTRHAQLSVETSSVSTRTLVSAQTGVPVYVTTRVATLNLGAANGVTHYQTILMSHATLSPALNKTSGTDVVTPFNSMSDCSDDSSGGVEACVTMDYNQITSGGRTYTRVNFYSYKWIRLDHTISWSNAS